jgi:REP element-mobilizing transposase RayT
MKRLPSLRRQLLAKIIERALLAQQKKLRDEGKTHFQLVDFSIQADHLHLIVEALDKRWLARGLMGLAARLARRLNKVLGRKGRFWSERYHRHDLRTPTETRNALRYVLLNIKKHARVSSASLAADPFSSAASFDGFSRSPNVSDDALHWPRVEPRTWLLRVGWRRRGLIDPADAPWSRPRRVPLAAHDRMWLASSSAHKRTKASSPRSAPPS